MKRWLQLLAALLALGTLTFWLATGAHRGWTRTSVAVEKTDEITGLTYREYESRFVPGVDVLGAGLLGALVVATAGVLMRGRSRPPDRSPP
ncbi:MAG: hypothetical protein M5U12_25370 [Verrucomicrobia bacterium]|nr:hypothetical protein [Verrucomicrobiota bacterium]